MSERLTHSATTPTREKPLVTARAALTTIQIIEDEELTENAAKIGAFALARLYDYEIAPPADRRRARARLLARHRAGHLARQQGAGQRGGVRLVIVPSALENGLSFKDHLRQCAHLDAAADDDR